MHDVTRPESAEDNEDMNIFDEIDTWERTEGKSLFTKLLSYGEPVILDYGCGAGNYTFAAAYAFGPGSAVYAADINRQSLDFIADKAKKENLVSVKTVTAREDYRQDFEDNTFDLVLYSDMFHGEEKQYGGLHRFVMIEEAKRTLKKGGIMAVIPFHLSNFRDKDKKKCKYTYKKLITEICGSGFEYIEKDLQGIHFEKAYSPYYQQKGGVSFEDLERGKILTFIK